MASKHMKNNNNGNINRKKANNVKRPVKNNRINNVKKSNISSKQKNKKKHVVAKRVILFIVVILIILAGVFTSKVVMNGGGLKGLLATLVGQTEETRKNMTDIEFLILGESLNLTDTIMIGKYDPNSQKASLVSIQRDTFIGDNPKRATAYDKINSVYQGKNSEKILKEVNELTGLNLKYYVAIDTKGLRELVDAIGGVEFYVPMDMKYDDTSQDLHINLKEGLQKLNGDQAEQVLRFRHNNDGTTYSSSYGTQDTGRMRTQRDFISALLKQTLKLSNISKIGELIDIANNNIETNMTTNQIFSFYDIALKIVDASKTKDAFNMQRLYISGYDQYIFDYSNLYNAGMKLNLYNFIPYDQSLDEVKKAMKSNLGYETEIIKNFDFDINTKYEEKVIGKGTYSVTNKLNLLPNFVGKDQSVAINYGRNNNIAVKVETVSGSNGQFVGQIISQTPYSNIDTEFMDKSKGITIKVVSSIPSSNIDNNTDNTNPEKNENDIIIDNEE